MVGEADHRPITNLMFLQQETYTRSNKYDASLRGRR